jgi:hypothetical protein
VFFTSFDEARLIENTIGGQRQETGFDEQSYIRDFLEFLAEKFWPGKARTRLFGVTVSDGAFEKHAEPGGRTRAASKITSRFMAGEVVDLVGAGDSFRAGLITYIASNLDDFKGGTMDFEEAVQAGNLFASLYIKAPLDDRYGNIRRYSKMLSLLRTEGGFHSFDDLRNALD